MLIWGISFPGYFSTDLKFVRNAACFQGGSFHHHTNSLPKIQLWEESRRGSHKTHGLRETWANCCCNFHSSSHTAAQSQHRTVLKAGSSNSRSPILSSNTLWGAPMPGYPRGRPALLHCLPSPPVCARRFFHKPMKAEIRLGMGNQAWQWVGIWGRKGVSWAVDSFELRSLLLQTNK